MKFSKILNRINNESELTVSYSFHSSQQQQQQMTDQQQVNINPNSEIQQEKIAKQDYHKIRNTQQNLVIVERIIFFFYGIMSFFQQQSVDPQYIYTSYIFGVIPQKPYTFLETVVMLVLVIGNSFRMKKLKFKQKLFEIAGMLITAVVVFSNVYYWFTNKYYYQIGILLRPFFMVFLSRWLMKCLKQAWAVFIDCYRYFLLLWFILLMFAGLGALIYGDIIFDDGTENIFKSLWQSFFFLYVMQTFAYYPDPSLPYYSITKLSVLFFLPIMVINGIMLATVIISTTYSSYRSITDEQDKDSLKVIQLMFLVVNSKIDKQEQKRYIQDITGIKKKIILFFASKTYNFIMEIYCITLFIVLAIDTKDKANQTEAILLIIYNIVTLIQNACKIYGYSFKLNYIHIFDLYRSAASLWLIIAYLLIPYYFDYYHFFLFILLLFPNMLRYILSLLLLSQSAVRYLLRLVDFGGMLYIITLLFAAIGQVLFSHLHTDLPRIQQYLSQKGQNALYTYMNFNNTVSSFVTLFPLLLGKYYIMDYANIMGLVVPKVYFLVYHTFGNLVVYKQLISTTLNHIALQTSREQAIITHKQTYKQYLTNKFEIQRVFEALIQALRTQYLKTNQEKYNKQIIDDFSLNFPFPMTESCMLKDINTFSLIFCNNLDIGDCWLEAATEYTQDLTPTNKVLQLNDIINKIKGKNEKWYRVSGRQLLEQRGYDFQDPQQFFQKLNFDLDELGIQVSFEFNRIQALVEKYMIELEYTDKPVYLFYDFGQKIMNRNVVDLYINNEPIAISFNYQLGTKKYLIEKMQISKIGDYFGTEIHVAKDIQQEFGQI